MTDSPAPESPTDPGKHDATPPVGAVASEPSTPIVPLLKPPKGRLSFRFSLLYGALGAVLIAAVAGFVILVLKPATSSSVPWSNWRPAAGTTAKMATEIAQHVSAQYHLNSTGSQLVAVVAEAPQVTSGTHKITISNFAVKSAKSSTGIQVIPSGKTWTEQLCGLGTSCSISSGTATVMRGRLVRREALEVALYTFKFVPAIDSIVAFMPPPPGENATTLLYLQKSNLKNQLSKPLDETLPLAKPPLPTFPDSKERATIDKLTLPNVYSYSLQALQDNSALLVMNPFPTSQ